MAPSVRSSPSASSFFAHGRLLKKIYGDDTKVVFLGDSNVRSSVELTARYGHGMKTDIVQVAHHGLNDSNVGIYYMLQAKTALYPTAQQYFQKKMDSEANRAVLKTCREHYLAGEGTRRFCFPYHLGESELISREIQEM